MPAPRGALALTGISGLVAALDQLTKWALVRALGPGQPASRVEVGGGWLALEYSENRGAAFGLLNGMAPMLAIASIVILLGLLLHHLSAGRPSVWQTVAVGAILGGAIGNFIDRVRHGYVVDFVSVGPWPNFNLADSAITVGVVVLAWCWSRPERRFVPRRAA